MFREECRKRVWSENIFGTDGGLNMLVVAFWEHIVMASDSGQNIAERL